MTIASTATHRAGAERRTLHVADVNIRALDDGRLEYTGYAAVWDAPYPTGSNRVERVIRGAFTDTLAADPDVRLLTQHDAATVMARTTAGDLFLTEDDHGLAVRALLDPEDPDVIRAERKVRNKHITGMSFAFWIMANGEERVTVDGVVERHLTRLDLDGGDVAIVTYPAYVDTAAEFRAIDALGQLAELTASSESRARVDDAGDVDLEQLRIVVDRLEARATSLTHDDLRMRIWRAVNDVLGGETYDFWYWLVAVADDWVVVRAVSYGESDPLETGWYQSAYTVDGDDNVTIEGAWTEVLPRTVWDPAPPSTDQGEASTGDTPSTMSIDEARTQTLKRRRH